MNPAGLTAGLWSQNGLWRDIMRIPSPLYIQRRRSDLLRITTNTGEGKWFRVEIWVFSALDPLATLPLPGSGCHSVFATFFEVFKLEALLGHLA